MAANQSETNTIFSSKKCLQGIRINGKNIHPLPPFDIAFDNTNYTYRIRFEWFEKTPNPYGNLCFTEVVGTQVLMLAESLDFLDKFLKELSKADISQRSAELLCAIARREQLLRILSFANQNWSPANDTEHVATILKRDVELQIKFLQALAMAEKCPETNSLLAELISTNADDSHEEQ